MLIKIIGPAFSKDDLMQFAKVLREIEQRDKVKLYFMFIEDKSLSIEKAGLLVKEIFDSIKVE